MGVVKNTSDKRKRGDIRGYFAKQAPNQDCKNNNADTTATVATPIATRPCHKKIKLKSSPLDRPFQSAKCPFKVLSTFGAWNVNSLCSRLRNDVWVKAIRSFLDSTKIQCLFLSEVKLRAAGPYRWRPSQSADKRAAGEYELIRRHLRKGGAFEVMQFVG